MAKTPEGILEDYAENLATQNGFLYLKFVSGVTGVPDRIIIGDGKVVFMELKQTNGRLSSRQKLMITYIRQHGGIVYVPFDKADIDRAFEELKTLSYTKLKAAHKHDKLYF